jgi:hypothetical protein
VKDQGTDEQRIAGPHVDFMCPVGKVVLGNHSSRTPGSRAWILALSSGGMGIERPAV